MVCLLGESWLLPMYPETEKIVPPKRCTQGGMMTLANRSLGFFQLVSMKMVNSSDFLKWHFILKIMDFVNECCLYEIMCGSVGRHLY